jgi:AcrR family transcriptional regulator
MAAIEKADVRRKLVDTAGRLFYTQGYQATGINQIIEEADVCKASFYNHFPTKEDLLVAWLERSHNEVTVELRGLLARPLGARELVEEFFKFHELQLSTKAYRGCPFMNCLAEIPVSEGRVRQVMRWHLTASRQILEEIVSRVMQERDLRHGSFTALADDLEVVIQGGLAMARAAGDIKQIRHAQKMAERILGLD